MRTLQDYILAAKARNNCTSDRQLAAFLALSPTTLFNMQRGRHWPSDDLMIRIAKAAGFDEQAALLDLCIWRNQHGPARSTYLEIARRLGKSAGALFLAGSLGATALAVSAPQANAYALASWTISEQVRTTLEPNVYYGKCKVIVMKWMIGLLLALALCLITRPAL